MLFTDFGLEGPYTGQVAAVLQQEASAVPVISLFADLPPGEAKPAAYLLAAYAKWFPAGTVLLCVVDPGVGSDRHALIVEADGRFYVGPDNGLFELVLRRAKSARVSAITWRSEELSASFHGRDLFAPMAARLAKGDSPPGREHRPLRHESWPDDLPEIVYVDHYGNALTGLRAGAVPREAVLSTDSRRVAHAETFSAVPPGVAFWYENSNGLIEIAVNLGRADAALSLAIGSPIMLAR